MGGHSWLPACPPLSPQMFDDQRLQSSQGQELAASMSLGEECDLDIAHRQGQCVVPPPVVLVWGQGHSRRQRWGALAWPDGPALIPPPCDAITRHCQACTSTTGVCLWTVWAHDFLREKATKEHMKASLSEGSLEVQGLKQIL